MSKITIAVRSPKTIGSIEFDVFGSKEVIEQIIEAEVGKWGTKDGAEHMVTRGKQDLENDRIAVCLQPNTVTGNTRGTQTAATELKAALAESNIHSSTSNHVRDIIASEPCSYTSLEDQADQGLPYREL